MGRFSLRHKALIFQRIGKPALEIIRFFLF